MKRITIVLAIASLMVCLNQAKAEFPVYTDPGQSFSPSINGDMVVWVNEPYEVPFSFYGYNLESLDSFSFDPGVTDFYTPPMISGDIVVWSCDREDDWNVYGYNISTSTELPICTNTSKQIAPSISGDIVVWTDYRNSECDDICLGDIYGYDLGTRTEFEICTDSADQYYPSISGDIVVWEDNRSGNWDIYGYDLSTRTEFPICTEPGDQNSSSVSGNIVVWKDSRSDSPGIYGYDLSTETEFPISTDSSDKYYPRVSGDFVVWQDERNGSAWPKVYGYIISRGEEFHVTSKFSEQRFPSISNGIIVYEVNGPYSSDIYGISTDDFHFYDFILVFKDIPYNGTTVGHKSRDMSSCGYKDAIDSWHYFTPADDGDYKISLCGSKFDTTLAVYDELEGIEITCNDDSCGKQSQVLLKARAGIRYTIRVSGYDGQEGDYTLLITECRPLQSDLNGDCAVNLLDFTKMASEWLQEGTP